MRALISIYWKKNLLKVMAKFISLYYYCYKIAVLTFSLVNLESV